MVVAVAVRMTADDWWLMIIHSAEAEKKRVMQVDFLSLLYFFLSLSHQLLWIHLYSSFIPSLCLFPFSFLECNATATAWQVVCLSCLSVIFSSPLSCSILICVTFIHSFIRACVCCVANCFDVGTTASLQGKKSNTGADRQTDIQNRQLLSLSSCVFPYLFSLSGLSCYACFSERRIAVGRGVEEERDREKRGTYVCQWRPIVLKPERQRAEVWWTIPFSALAGWLTDVLSSFKTHLFFHVPHHPIMRNSGRASYFLVPKLFVCFFFSPSSSFLRHTWHHPIVARTI